MRIIQHGKHVTVTTYQRTFAYTSDLNAGFAFDSDMHGNVDVSKLYPCGRDNYNQVLTGTIDGKSVTDTGVREYTRTHYEYSVGKCKCGVHVQLDSFTNTCDGCGRDYNMSGQLLASRSQWGEETNESLADILSI